MSQKNETIPLLLALLITGGIFGAGFWWFTRNSGINLNNSLVSNDSSSQSFNNNESKQSKNSTVNDANFEPPSDVPAGTTIRINGSTSMVVINKVLKNRFEQQFPGTIVTTQAGGSNKGIEDLIAGKVDIAAISRPLSDRELANGVVAIPVVKDAIAIVIGSDNILSRGLSQQQVEDIFLGKINNWSVLGGESANIRVVNRPAISGTYQVFKEIVLKGNNFATSPNITIMQEDVTTPLLRLLRNDGIGYATYAQVVNQRTVRTIAIDGLTPEATNYPYQRTLYYAYQQPASPQVRAFLGYTFSPQGKQVVVNLK
jgi:phosphate transport system substrate-binding protein